MTNTDSNKAPCGLDNCSKCEVCKYDLPLDFILNNINNSKMKEFGIVPMAGNPATAQIIFPGQKPMGAKPFGAEPVQLSIPFVENKKLDSLCNGCEFLSRTARPGQTSTHNCRCSAVDDIVNGKIIRLKVYPGEKIKKPFWCPILKDKIINGGGATRELILPARVNNSAMSDEQLENWNKSKAERLQKEKWLSLPGLTSWADIRIGRCYHMPPMFKKGRMDLFIANKYCDSIMAYQKGTNKRVWIYKQDEEYKYFSLID